jgi:hypothetical protein
MFFYALFDVFSDKQKKKHAVKVMIFKIVTTIQNCKSQVERDL